MLSFWNMPWQCSQSPAKEAPAPSAASEPTAHTHLSLGPRGCFARAPLPGPFLCCHRRWAGQFSFDHSSWHPAPWSHPVPCPRKEESAGFNLTQESMQNITHIPTIKSSKRLHRAVTEYSGQSCSPRKKGSRQDWSRRTLFLKHLPLIMSPVPSQLVQTTSTTKKAARGGSATTRHPASTPCPAPAPEAKLCPTAAGVGMWCHPHLAWHGAQQLAWGVMVQNGQWGSAYLHCMCLLVTLPALRTTVCKEGLLPTALSPQLI